jgi:hypothetical protein
VQNISHVQHVVQINTKLIQSYKHIRLTILYIIVGLPVSYKTEFFTILQKLEINVFVKTPYKFAILNMSANALVL